MKIIGLMVTWNNLEFLRCSLPQALNICDEVILIEGCHSRQYPKRSTDGTCEYIQNFSHPCLRVFDFEQNDRYDLVQRRLRQDMPKQSQYWEPGNWVLYWDDDAFIFESDLKKLKEVILNTKHDTIAFQEKYFIYNFRFSLTSNIACTWPHSPHWNKITDGMYLRGVRNVYYKNKRRYSDVHWIDDVIQYHYSYVKLPERMRARWAMSVEKGTRQSCHRFREWMAFEWKNDDDFLRQSEKVLSIPGMTKDNIEVEVYNGDHPEAVADHPWRHVNDVRRIK